MSAGTSSSFLHFIIFLVFSSLCIASTGNVPSALPCPLRAPIPKNNSSTLKVPHVSPPINSLFLPPFAWLAACPLLAFSVCCPNEPCSLLEGWPLSVCKSPVRKGRSLPHVPVCKPQSNHRLHRRQEREASRQRGTQPARKTLLLPPPVEVPAVTG